MNVISTLVFLFFTERNRFNNLNIFLKVKIIQIQIKPTALGLSLSKKSKILDVLEFGLWDFSVIIHTGRLKQTSKSNMSSKKITEK